jgi:Fic family protein
MYRYSLTGAGTSALARIDELRARLDSQGPLPRVWRGRTRRDLEAEATAASTMLEGVAVTVDEARRILAGDRPVGVSEADAALVAGYRDAMHLVLARADAATFAWHAELLLAVHHRVLAGAHSMGAGRLRDGQNWLTNRVSGARVYLPPPSAAVPRLVEELCAWADASKDPPAVQAAVIHISLAGIHPFKDGNGRTARIAASLAMYRGGYRMPHFTSLEEWWGRHAESYYRAFDCLGGEWDPDADVSPFVEAHLSAQATQVEALSLRNATERALWTVLEDIAVHDLRLQDRTTHGLYDAFFAREVTNRYYRSLADVSDVTASHDLAKLVASGLLESRGAGRSAHYVATPELYRRVVATAELDAGWWADMGSSEDARDLAIAGLAARLHGSTGD